MPDASPSPHRILIVDDHAIVRQGIALLLTRQPDFEVCGEAGSYEEGLAAIAALKPDAVLVDITLKDRSGLDLVREAKERDPAIKTLILSMHDEEDYAERALKAGALGYVMKEHADEVVVEALRKVLRGEVYLSPLMNTRMIRQMIQGENVSEEETGIGSLTDREKEIFLLMGRGLSTKRIAEQLDLSARTVEVHRAHIKRKMQCDDLAQLLREAIRFAESQV